MVWLLGEMRVVIEQELSAQLVRHPDVRYLPLAKFFPQGRGAVKTANAVAFGLGKNGLARVYRFESDDATERECGKDAPDQNCHPGPRGKFVD